MSAKRSIFEEVAASPAAHTARVATKGGIDRARRGARGAIRGWLIGLFGLVFAMIAVGGLTRLTDSGLAITEWRPLTGALPPMSAADWQAEFARYRATPEFELINSAMTLAQFKAIYWWEWGHRQLGRVIGLVWALGFAWFLARRHIPAGWTGRLLTLGALGGAQGAVGWWMVSSGLGARMVDVASYRLAVHLGLALSILGLIAWYVLALGRDARELMRARRERESVLGAMAAMVLVLVFAQVLLGALVAGIDAGRSFPTWPLMNGAFFPADAFQVSEGGAPWRALFENPGLVQFVHRMVGYGVLVAALWAWWRSRKSALIATRRAFALVAVAVVAQIALGIATALYAAPWPVAIAHQAGAVIVVVVILRARFQACYPRAQALGT